MTAYTQPVVDPTNVVGRRIGAYAIDFTILLVLSLILIVPLFGDLADQREFPTAGQATDFCDQVNESSARSLCVNLDTNVYVLTEGDLNSFILRSWAYSGLLGLANLVVLQGLTGGSLGKLIVGLRVVREDGTVAHPGWALLRYVLLVVDSICFFLPGAVLVFTTKGHRRIGDMAASTFVVDKGHVGQPVQVPGLNAAWPGPGGQAWGAQAAPPPGAAVGAPPAAAPSGEGPTWDQARNAYIQYDRDRGSWMQWSDEAREWRPIDQ